MQRAYQVELPHVPAKRVPAGRKRGPDSLPVWIALVTVAAILVSVGISRRGRTPAPDRATNAPVIAAAATVVPTVAITTPEPIVPTEPPTDTTAEVIAEIPAEVITEAPTEALPEAAATPEAVAQNTPEVEAAESAALPSAPAYTDAPVLEPVVDYVVLDGVPQTDHPLGLKECAQVQDSYFDDAVFIGDSVTLKLNYFVRDNRSEYPTLLGGAQFLTAGSLGSGNALQAVTSDSLHPSYQGQKMALEDSVAAMGAKKVFIMLGMNDIAVYGPEESAKNMMRLARRIKDKSPDCTIFIESATPRIKGNYKKLNNNALFEYDLLLYSYCQQYANYGIHFVDIAYVMRDEEGNLPLNYCSDREGQGIHFTDTACKEWIKYLYTHALVENSI